MGQGRQIDREDLDGLLQRHHRGIEGIALTGGRNGADQEVRHPVAVSVASAGSECPEHGQDDVAVGLIDEGVDQAGEIGQGDWTLAPPIQPIQRCLVPEQGGKRLEALLGLVLADVGGQLLVTGAGEEPEGDTVQRPVQCTPVWSSPEQRIDDGLGDRTVDLKADR